MERGQIILPSYVLRSKEKIMYTFALSEPVAKKIQYFSLDNNVIDDLISIAFGTISNKGTLQIWDFLKKRPIFTLKISSEPVKFTWADVVLIEDNLVILAYSFQLGGIYLQNEWTEEKNGIIIELPVGPYMGFSLPIVIGHILKFLNSEDDLVSINILSKEAKVTNVPNVTHTTFIHWLTPLNEEIIPTRAVLASENGKIYLVDDSKTLNSTISSFDLQNNELIEMAKSEFELTVSSDENDAIPLACDAADEFFLIGTKANVIVILELNNDEFRIIKTKGLPCSGASLVKISPCKEYAIIAGWDSKIYIHYFTSLSYLGFIQYNFMKMYSMTHFKNSFKGNFVSAHEENLVVWELAFSKTLQVLK